MKITILAASAALLALSACGDRAEENAMDNIAMEPMDAGNDMAAAPGMANNGQEYASMAAASDMYEIEAGKLAMEKTQNAEIRELAQMIVTDHEKATADLMTAAQQAEPAIAVTPQMNAEQQSMMQALRSANGEQFDATWLNQQIMAHQMALNMVQGYAENGDVPSLKQHASTVAGPIRQHLERAQQLSQQMQE